MMPLSLANIGEENLILKVGGNPEVKKHLEDLGFVAGESATLISSLGGERNCKGQGSKNSHKRRNGKKNYGVRLRCLPQLRSLRERPSSVTAFCGCKMRRHLPQWGRLSDSSPTAEAVYK